MSRIQGKWKNQGETNWIILDKLIRDGAKNLPSIENKNGRNSLSHTSVRKGIEYLEKRFLVIQTDVDESIPRRPIRTFGPTTLGHVTWFTQTVKQGNKHDIKVALKNIHTVLPVILKKWNTLIKYYDEALLIKFLAKVFDNMEILAKDIISLKYKTFYRGVTMEIKNRQEHRDSETILQIFESEEFLKGFHAMVNFAFFLEIFKLYQRNYYDYDDKIGFKTKENIKDWIKIVKSDKELFTQIQIGFDNMKVASQITDEGIKQDLELILGKGNMYCQFCGETISKKDEEEHYQTHNNNNKITTMKELFEMPKGLENYYGNQMLLGRSEFEYELEFDRDSVYSFNKFFKV